MKKSIKLSAKIIGGFSIVTVLMVFVVGVYQFSSIKTNNGFESLLAHEIAVRANSSKTLVGLQEALRAKSNFLLTKDMKYMEIHNKNIDITIQRLQDIQAITKSNSDVGHANLAASGIALLEEYRSKVEEMVKSCQLIGLTPDEGMIGKFRTAAHMIEKALEQHDLDRHLINYLQVRRYEKDYVAEPAAKKERYLTAIKQFDTILKAKGSAVVAETQKTMEEGWSQYQAAANTILASAEIKEDGPEYKAVRDAAHIIEKAINTANIPAAEANFMRMRKSDKDYQLRLDLKYAKQVNEGKDVIVTSMQDQAIDKKYVEEITTLLDDYVKNFNRMVEEQGLIAKQKTDMQASIDKIEPLIEKIGEESGEEANKSQEEIVSLAKTMSKAAITASLVTIGLAMALGFALARSICRPINHAVNKMMVGAEQVAAASGQVSSSAQTLAEGATEQAASLEETSASMEEMSSMTRQNSDNASQADSLMRESLTIIKQADDSMTDMDRSMSEIAEASAQTSKIIKTIDEIAFQTNLLALNAAVEAARAGEAGAGFAVVAEEVRNLAMRSTEAAKNTATLIESTVNKVTSGKAIVKKATEGFHGVAESSAKVASLIGEIASASREQAQGFSQINQAITQMDTVTQQNSATAEESAAAATELNSQSAAMMEVVKDLQMLVSGGVAQATTVSASTNKPLNSSQVGPAGPTRHELPAPKRRSGHARKGSPSKANDVIPMDDAGGSFEEF